MRRIGWLAGLAAPLLLAGCVTAVGVKPLSGVEALKQELQGPPTNLVEGSLRKLADQAEADEPSLDVVQIEFRDEGEVLVYAIVRADTDDSQAAEAAVRRSLEAIWQATRDHAPAAAKASVVFLRPTVVTTLDRGAAQAALIVGAVVAPLDKVASYLDGPRSPEEFQALGESGTVAFVPLRQLYLGTPNHPIRSLEAG